MLVRSNASTSSGVIRLKRAVEKMPKKYTGNITPWFAKLNRHRRVSADERVGEVVSSIWPRRKGVEVRRMKKPPHGRGLFWNYVDRSTHDFGLSPIKHDECDRDYWCDQSHCAHIKFTSHQKRCGNTN